MLIWFSIRRSYYEPAVKKHRHMWSVPACPGNVQIGHALSARTRVACFGMRHDFTTYNILRGGGGYLFQECAVQDPESASLLVASSFMDNTTFLDIL